MRDAVRKTYRSLYEGDDSFGWDTTKSSSDNENKKTILTVIKEVKSQIPDVPSNVIKEAVKTYFISCRGSDKLKTTGKYDKKCSSQRKCNRLIRKMKHRKSALMKTRAISEDKKKDWLPCLVTEMMSSEESDVDESDGTRIYVTKQLPWRSDKLNQFLDSLDNKAKKYASQRSRMMKFKRVCGLPSDRPKPLSSNIPTWAIQ